MRWLARVMEISQRKFAIFLPASMCGSRNERHTAWNAQKFLNSKLAGTLPANFVHRRYYYSTARMNYRAVG